MSARARQIEENIRMLAGRQWDVYSDVLGRYVDVTRYMTDSERRWRQRPVVNLLENWFRLTHARLTENPPIVTFQPSTGDRTDAMLAEVLDTIFKTIWRDAGLPESDDRVTRWMVGAGYGYLKSMAEFTGPERELVGPATLSMDTPDGPLERVIEHAPYDAQGNPLVSLTEDGNGYDITGAPGTQREGSIRVDVLNPLECRGEWNEKPWHKKRWHIHRSYLTCDEVYDKWGVECEPDTYLSSGGSDGYLERLLRGDGYFGASNGDPLASSTGTMARDADEGLVCVDELWEAPSGNLPQTDSSPGGRLLIVTAHHVLHDSERPYPYRYTSPIRYFEFVGLPGRPVGSTPLEMLVPLQKTFNRGVAQGLEHRNLLSNPKLLIDASADIEDGEITNAPGETISGGMKNGAPMVSYLAPPNLSSDYYKVQSFLFDTIQTLGNVHGAEGTAPTDDSSGQLVKELRFNSDRFSASAARGKVMEYARLAEDWIAMLPTLWPVEKILTYAGEDSVIRTVTVLPEMWDGSVNVVPDVESMLPEGRGERQARVTALYQEGVFGPPGTPQAVKTFLDLARFPQMGRVYRPGGVNRITAERNLGALVRGTPAAEIPIFPWYDLQIHVAVTEEYMSSGEYTMLDDATQSECVQFRELLRAALVTKTLDDQRIAGQLALAGAAQQASVQAQTASLTPPPVVPEGTPSSARPTPPPGAGAPDSSAATDRAA